jgi:dipeptidase E
MNLLLLSNSTKLGEPFLAWPREQLRNFLGSRRRIAFVPFAAVTTSFDDFAELVSQNLPEPGHEVVSLHSAHDPVAALSECDVVAVGGGNTFHLLRELYRTRLLGAIAERVRNGMPYVGWSAGSNVACPTIMTTNDMPVCEPPSLRAMNLIPFQINPHYSEARLDGQGGECRDDRIREFLALNPHMVVAGLREGSLLHVQDDEVTCSGNGMRVFRANRDPVELASGARMRLDLQQTVPRG